MASWLMKTEPETYSFDDLVKSGRATWDGVRSYAARLHLMAMKQGDTAFIYHSMGPKEIVGIAVVVGEHHPDPKDDTGKWVAVDIEPVAKLARPITLAEVKAHPTLQKMELVRQSRLSVAPVSAAEDKLLRKLASKPVSTSV